MIQEQQTGTIERITDRRFGFIRIDGERRNIFFHAKDVQRGLRFDEIEQGDRVSFSTTTTDKGLAAIGVDIIGRPVASLPHGTGDDADDNTYDWGQRA